MTGIDVIGDVHGQGERLDRFLRILGYQGAYYTHPDGRTAIFIGDLIDRGTEHARVFDIVRRMEAPVLLGNHELNAICYARKGVRGHIRPHTETNTADHAAFLAEYPFGSPAYQEIIQWFEGFPVYLKRKNLSLIHACWNQNAIDVCAPHLRKDKNLKLSAYEAYDTEIPDSFHRALDHLVKGPEVRLPRGIEYVDSHGHPRKNARLYWWQYRDVPLFDIFQHSQNVIQFFSSKDLRSLHSIRNKFNYISKVPVLFGHYNVDCAPILYSERAGCVNFKNRLVAYRWMEGDRKLTPAQLVHD
jgi:hypothetical protein